jgi:hypothetical protein
VRRQEQRSERQDDDEPRQDEARAAGDRSPGAREPPGAEDRQLRRGRSWQQVGGRDTVLEFLGRQPVPLLDAQLAEQGDMRRRAAEPDAPDPAPLADDREQADAGAFRLTGNAVSRPGSVAALLAALRAAPLARLWLGAQLLASRLSMTTCRTVTIAAFLTTAGRLFARRSRAPRRTLSLS